MTAPTDSFASIVAELRNVADGMHDQSFYNTSDAIDGLVDRIERLDAEMRKEVEIRLFDGQWVNIVNAPGQTIEGAVKATEVKMRENITRGWPPLRPEYKELRARLAACEDVTDEMVEAARDAYTLSSGDHKWAMRAALQAAIATRASVPKDAATGDEWAK